MTVMRFLALAGMLTRVFPLASLATNNPAKGQKKNVDVPDQVVLAGKTLKPGQYKVEWQGNGPMANVKFLQSNKTVLTAPAKIAQLRQKAPYDAVVENTAKNGTKTIREDRVEQPARSPDVWCSSSGLSRSSPPQARVLVAPGRFV